jgi:pilus assembly protein Flp/PilA
MRQLPLWDEEFMRSASRVLRTLIRDDEAATMPEYALMVALIALVCFAAVQLIGTNATTQFNNVATSIGAG